MAIRGSNLIHRQWHGKENCFNLCLQTNIKNGDPFNCKSFEHWHRECSPTNTNDDQICASFAENDHLVHRNHLHHNKRAVKMDICVLSNQTIKTSGGDFVPNNVVTYYELICDKPVVSLETKSNKPSTTSFSSSISSSSTSELPTSQIPSSRTSSTSGGLTSFLSTSITFPTSQYVRLIFF